MEPVNICKAKVEEKAEKITVRTEEEKKIAHEQRKAKEAKAKMELHEAKARHAAGKLGAKQSHVLGHHHEPHLVGTNQVYNEPVVGTHGHHGHHVHQPVGAVAPTTGSAVPTYPLGGQHGPTGRQYL